MIIKTPYHYAGRANFEDGKISKGINFTASAEQQLVIEYISAHISVPIGQELSGAAIITTVNGVRAHHYFVVSKTSNFEDKVIVHIAGCSTRIYADPGTEIILSAWKNSSFSPQPVPGDIRITISGYLLPI